MTICKKCGKEIPDGEELCEDCRNTDHDTGESYLDELMRDMGMDEYRNLEGHKLSERSVKSGEDKDTEEAAGLEEAAGPEEKIEPEEAAGLEEDIPLMDMLSELEVQMEEESGAEPEPEPEIALEPEPEPEIAIEPEPETEIAIEPEPEPEPEPEIAIEPAPEPEPETEIALEPEPESEPEMIEYEPDEPEEQSYESNESRIEEAGDDIDELLDILASEDEEFEEDDSNEDDIEEMPAFEEEDSESPLESGPLPVPEASFFAEDEGGDIFADGSDAGTGEAPSVEDVFQDALSAVDYSGDSADGGEEEIFSLDEFGAEETEGDTQGDAVQDIALADPVKPIRKKKEPKPKKEKKDSFWKRIFGNIITEQTAEEEAKEREMELADAEERAKLKEEKKKQEAAAKQEKAEQAKAEKDRKAAEKAEKATAKAAEKEEKKRLKLEREANEVVGKINPVGATIVMVFFGVIAIVVLLGTQTFSYSSAVNGAESHFDKGDYEQAYESLSGVEVSEKSTELADKVRICMQLQKELNSYTNYYEMKMYLEALDSLMKGIRSYDENKTKADDYGILGQYNALEGQIAQNLYSEFGVSESQARNINGMESQEEYTARLEEIISRWEEKMRADER